MMLSVPHTRIHHEEGAVSVCCGSYICLSLRCADERFIKREDNHRSHESPHLEATRERKFTDYVDRGGVATSVVRDDAGSTRIIFFGYTKS